MAATSDAPPALPRRFIGAAAVLLPASPSRCFADVPHSPAPTACILPHRISAAPAGRRAALERSAEQAVALAADGGQPGDAQPGNRPEGPGHAAARAHGGAGQVVVAVQQAPKRFVRQQVPAEQQGLGRGSGSIRCLALHAPAPEHRSLVAASRPRLDYSRHSWLETLRAFSLQRAIFWISAHVSRLHRLVAQ